MTEAHKVYDAIEIEDLTVVLGERTVVCDLDLKIPLGKLCAVVGPNGAGKTTLIKTIVSLIKPVSGQVRILGRPFSVSCREVAYVPQRSGLDWDFPATVADVALMGTHHSLPWWKGLGRGERDRAATALAAVGLEELRDRPISNLSGGQQQRVLLARALAQQAEVFLLDEPFQGVDAASESAIMRTLTSMRDHGKTVMVVHHDLHAVAERFDHAILMNVRKIADGPVSTVITPENLRRTFGTRIGFDDIGKREA